MSGTGIGAPVPLSVTVTGFSSPSSDGISKLLLDTATETGAKRTVTVHMAAGAITWPEQLSACRLNGAAGAVSVPIVRLPLPSFVTVTVWSDVIP